METAPVVASHGEFTERVGHYAVIDLGQWLARMRTACRLCRSISEFLRSISQMVAVRLPAASYVKPVFVIWVQISRVQVYWVKEGAWDQLSRKRERASDSVRTPFRVSMSRSLANPG